MIGKNSKRKREKNGVFKKNLPSADGLEIMEALGLGAVALLVSALVAGLVAWVVWLKGGAK